ncbi:TolB family protein [Phytomonospora endophytica]|uniref:TolB n=1 Tax=Phytomonospora endophytica TaxID=714109 RepID=A0A841FA11_9ACTN|nr:PD40 domain-containing protein [Phytomonospora endophytica]MBB6033086.1 hypothetical protein [Phytomonospora endophytica]GIG65313.1 TolB-like translocation protein; signal peptide [Phytomonospora endophytica]
MTRRRIIAGACAIALVLAVGAVYVVWRGASAGTAAAGPPLDLTAAGSVVYVSGDGLTRQTGSDATGPACQRTYAAAGTLSCLYGLGPAFSAELVVYDVRLAERLRLPIWGTPSRTRVSPSGNLVAWTVFREGDSYLAHGRFSTTAGIYNLRTGEHHGSLEDYTSFVDGVRVTAEDVNYWGITFAADDVTFYATMSTGGRTWLMRGDMAARTLTAMRENVECPSLSPDGTHIAYKRRTGERWRLHVLDLASGTDVALAETGHVDDQPAWLPGGEIGYAKPHEGRPAVFSVPADGSGEPRMLFAGSSPAAIGTA